ncbi:TPA: hypothetical protein QDZ10_001903 [Stenotrophomonas maltophilia]|nr:hypothetical protein [Stenotrophomonas maltophilia]
MMLFYHCEGDPNILAAEYAGIALDLTTSEAEAIADAIVVFQDGSSQALALDDGSPRALARIAALRQSCGSSVTTISAGDLLASSTRIRNWKAAIAAYHRCMGADIPSVVQEVKDYVRLRRTTTVGSLVRDLNGHHPSLVVGATVFALRTRSITSNMDSSPWCMHTRLARPGHDVRT